MSPRLSLRKSWHLTWWLNAAFSSALLVSSIIDYLRNGSFLPPGNETPTRSPFSPQKFRNKGKKGLEGVLTCIFTHRIDLWLGSTQPRFIPWGGMGGLKLILTNLLLQRALNFLVLFLWLVSHLDTDLGSDFLGTDLGSDFLHSSCRSDFLHWANQNLQQVFILLNYIYSFVFLLHATSFLRYPEPSTEHILPWLKVIYTSNKNWKTFAVSPRLSLRKSWHLTWWLNAAFGLSMENT